MEKKDQDVNIENSDGDRHQRRSRDDDSIRGSPRQAGRGRAEDADTKIAALEDEVKGMNRSLSRILQILDKPGPSTKVHEGSLIRDPRKGKEPMEHTAESGTRSRGKKTDSMTSKVRGLKPTDRTILRSPESSTLKGRHYTVSTPSYGHTKTDLRNLIVEKRRSAKTAESEAKAAEAEARAAEAEARAAEAEARLAEAEAKKDDLPWKTELLNALKELGNPQGDQ